MLMKKRGDDEDSNYVRGHIEFGLCMNQTRYGMQVDTDTTIYVRMMVHLPLRYASSLHPLASRQL